MALTKVTSGVRDLGTGEVVATDLASTIDLSSKTVTLPSAAVTAHVTAFDDNQLKEDIALLAFKQATSDSVVKYDLVDQTVDVFSDASGINTGNSTDEGRDASGNYYSGSQTGSILNAYTSGSGNFTAPAGVTSVEVLVVAAGGGGGGCGGGGGAGGVVHHTGYTVVPSSTYAYSVGTGGSGSQYSPGGGMAGSGGNSTFDTITATGGGGGSGTSSAGSDGGSGGGGCSGYNSAGGSGTQGDSGGGTGYGNDAGAGTGGGNWGGGGGGANAAGTAGQTISNTTGAGGDGKYFANFNMYGTDSSNAKPDADGSGSGKGYFGGGGSGGGGSTAIVGEAGVGGGAKGEWTAPSPSGQANTGGGAGGGSNRAGSSGLGGTGGSGIVLIRQADAYNDMTLVSNSTTADTANKSRSGNDLQQRCWHGNDWIRLDRRVQP